MSRRNPAAALSVVGVAAAVGARARPSTNAATTSSSITSTTAIVRRPRADATTSTSLIRLRDLARGVEPAGARRTRLGRRGAPPVLLDEALQSGVIGAVELVLRTPGRDGDRRVEA